MYPLELRREMRPAESALIADLVRAGQSRPKDGVASARLGPAMTGERMIVHRQQLDKISPAFSSVADPTGFLDEFIDQGLADPARDVLVDRIHRPAHRRVPLRPQRDCL